MRFKYCGKNNEKSHIHSLRNKLKRFIATGLNQKEGKFVEIVEIIKLPDVIKFRYSFALILISGNIYLTSFFIIGITMDPFRA